VPSTDGSIAPQRRAERSGGMDLHHTPEAAGYAPLTVDTEGLAQLLGMSKSWVEKRVQDRDWTTGRIPVPFEISPTRRLWLHSGVVRWAEAVQARAEARFAHAGQVTR
jgi:predicted DNA-binding transcriptional regulator AlpA